MPDWNGNGDSDGEHFTGWPFIIIAIFAIIVLVIGIINSVN
jgi:hypothetical protein